MMKKFKTIFFDFDGTIVDTMSKAIEIYNRLALKNNYNVIDENNLREFKNMRIQDSLKKLKIPLRRLPSIANKIRRKLKFCISEIPVCKGIPGVLEKIKQMNYRAGIVSSNYHKNIQLFLKYNNLDNFDFIFAYKEVFGKHRVIKKAIKKHNLLLGEIIYIGDEIRDIDACRKVGIKIISVCWGFNGRDALIKENADFIAEHPDDIFKYI